MSQPEPHAQREGGFAMIVAIVIATVAILVVTLILTTGVRLNSSTVRERDWQLAFQVAESGVENSVTQLRSNNAYSGTTGPTPVSGGEFEVKVQTKGSGKVVDALGYVPSKNAPNVIKRRLTVEYQPEPSFRYALFSNSSLFINSGNGVVKGDVFGNQDVVIDNTSEVVGSVVSATGKVSLDQNAKVRKSGGTGGDVTSGGYDTSTKNAVDMALNSVVEGDVRIKVASGACASSTALTGATSGLYKLANNGSIGGTVRMPDGATATPPILPAAKRVATCAVTEGAKALPTYTFDPSNYPGLQTKTATWFNGGGPALSGAYYITDDGAGYIDLSKRQVGGTLTLISEPKIIQSNSGPAFFPSSGLGSAIVQIIALNTSTDPASPSFQVQNQFNVPTGPDAPAVLVYSRGFCDFKNTTIDNGAVYCNGMNIKNGLEITYDPRIERLLGFGSAKLVRSSFVERPSSTPLP